MNTKKITSKGIFHIPLILCLTLFISLTFFVKLCLTLRPFMADYVIYLSEHRLFWNKINPIEISGQGAFPWSYILDSFFVNGFLPEPGCYIYGFIVMLAIFAAMCAVVYKIFQSKLHLCKKKCVSFSLLIVFCLYSWTATLAYGNIGALCCIFAVLSLFFSTKNKILSGIFLGLALIKPHATGLFLLLFIFLGYYSAVIISVGMVIVAFLGACTYLSTSPVQILLSLFSNGTDGGLNFESLGIASILHSFGVSTGIAFGCSFLISLVYAILLFCYLKRNNITDCWALACPFSIGVTLWFYENTQDEYILIIPLLIFVTCLYKKYGQFKCNLPEGIMLFILSMGAIGTSLLINTVLEVVGKAQLEIFWALESVFHLCIAYIGIYIAKMLVSFQHMDNKKSK